MFEGLSGRFDLTNLQVQVKSELRNEVFNQCILTNRPLGENPSEDLVSKALVS